MRRTAAGLVLAALLGACASAGKDASGGKSGLVKPEELPPREREVLEAWRAGGARWDAERERVVADPELSRFLVNNLVVQMVRSYDRSAVGSAFRPSTPFTQAQDELVRIADRSTPVLVEMLLLRDDIVAFLAADTLRRIGAPAVDPVAAKLGSGPPEIRRRLAELAGTLPESPTGEAAILETLGRAAARPPTTRRGSSGRSPRGRSASARPGGRRRATPRRSSRARSPTPTRRCGRPRSAP